MFRRKPPEPKECEVHDLDVRGVHTATIWGNGQFDDDGKEKLPTARQTRVLWACRHCDFRVVRMLDGHWSVEQLARRRPWKKGFESPWEGYETR